MAARPVKRSLIPVWTVAIAGIVTSIALPTQVTAIPAPGTGPRPKNQAKSANKKRPGPPASSKRNDNRTVKSILTPVSLTCDSLLEPSGETDLITTIQATDVDVMLRAKKRVRFMGFTQTKPHARAERTDLFLQVYQVTIDDKKNRLRLSAVTSPSVHELWQVLKVNGTAPGTPDWPKEGVKLTVSASTDKPVVRVKYVGGPAGRSTNYLFMVTDPLIDSKDRLFAGATVRIKEKASQNP